MQQELESLRAEIVQRFGTVHCFCRKNDQLNRSTVYMILNGNYPGNTEAQLKKIKLILNTEDQSQSVFKAIKGEACKRCAVHGKCSKCDRLFKDQANAVMKIFSD